MTSVSSCFLVTGGLDDYGASGPPLNSRIQESGAAMDWLERSFMAVTLLCAVGAAISIAWIMLI
ncbi:MAG: hypothetical protein JO141_30170 [Bradyrhizobium sp.]|nr:hypothetical protein [Bradyrhizobium sp.]